MYTSAAAELAEYRKLITFLGKNTIFYKHSVFLGPCFVLHLSQLFIIILYKKRYLSKMDRSHINDFFIFSPLAKFIGAANLSRSTEDNGNDTTLEKNLVMIHIIVAHFHPLSVRP